MAHPQKVARYSIRTIAFYNVENLFDTVNDSLFFDDEMTPDGNYNWTLERYSLKIQHIAEVISKIGRSITQTCPDIVGLSEVENLHVIKDLINHPLLRTYDFKIIHFDSPDERGIDVALIYKSNRFIPISFKSHRLLIFNDSDQRDFTRDQLVVEGLLEGEEFYIIVSHWPSRSGGAARSQPFRKAAARLNRRIIDSVLRINLDAKIISMGDLNDNPNDSSIKNTLTSSDRQNEESPALFNPMQSLYKKGNGSLAYRDQWNLFDQILLSKNLVNENRKSYTFWKAGIYHPAYLRIKSGNYKGYPFRTYVAGRYTGGYSDHFPVYAFLIKKVD
ncbi:endonuclease/exonuclease/phosphatase family protein [uncultured Eudoraea sp.]|uniref:endonuclease/exonuclease/phosphatase family protein n=1 Tax=uncultured Eudoraea sp. TaxID=1035614 RepID=UPI0026118566|nr:endonuclease/exonuclease/phosphatase family protein [uncultured Eudoraea sp.]